MNTKPPFNSVTTATRKNSKPVALLGITDLDRQARAETYLTMVGWVKAMPEPMKARFNEWKSTLTGEYYRKMTQFWHDRIYAMHLKLRERGVPHLFWTTYNNFKEIPNHQDWHGHFYKPYDTDGCMTKFFAGRGIHANAGDEFHYDQIAHQVWAQELALHVARDLP